MKAALLNVYGPQAHRDKDALWLALTNLIQPLDYVWILFGDFNVVRTKDERYGSLFDHREASSFNDFISRLGLQDFQIGAIRFMKFSRDGKKMSNVERFLVNSNFLQVWNNSQVTALPRTLSDHCPILLTTGDADFGPKTFKIFNHWFSSNNFAELMESSWKSGDFTGTSDVILINKIKKLRKDIKSGVK